MRAVCNPVSAINAPKILTVTSAQLEDIRVALVEQHGRLDKHRASASQGVTREYWAGQIRRLDDLLLLVAKA